MTKNLIVVQCVWWPFSTEKPHWADAQKKLGGRYEHKKLKRFVRDAHFTRVIFGEFSSLKCIGSYAFPGDGMSEVTIPDSGEELGASCFETGRLTRENRHRRITFGDFQSLKRIGFRGF